MSEKLDPQARAAEKAESRARDALALKSGEKSAADLIDENNAFAGLKFSVDWTAARGKK